MIDESEEEENERRRFTPDTLFGFEVFLDDFFGVHRVISMI